MEENVEFREAVLAAGFNSNSYEGIAEAIGCSVPYCKANSSRIKTVFNGNAQ